MCRFSEVVYSDLSMFRKYVFKVDKTVITSKFSRHISILLDFIYLEWKKYDRLSSIDFLTQCDMKKYIYGYNSSNLRNIL